MNSKNKYLLAYNSAQPPIGNSMVVLPVIDSTNNYAMGQARAGLAAHGSAFLAYAQSQGKGQRGKQWEASPGENLLMSVVLDAQWLETKLPFLLSAAVALACHDFFSRYANPELTRIKWPNDLYWQDRKAGGILIENSFSAPTSEKGDAGELSGWKWAIAGMGINVNQTRFPEHLSNAVSLKQITGTSFDLIALARELCSCLEQRLQVLKKTPDQIINTYNQRLYKIHEWVRLKKDQAVFRSCIQGVDETGCLHTRDELDQRFAFGEVEWVKN